MPLLPVFSRRFFLQADGSFEAFDASGSGSAAFNPFDLFQRMFGGRQGGNSSPGAGFGGATGFGGLSGFGGLGGFAARAGAGAGARKRRRWPPRDSVVSLPVTLEELSTGTSRKFRFACLFCLLFSIGVRSNFCYLCLLHFLLVSLPLRVVVSRVQRKEQCSPCTGSGVFATEKCGSCQGRGYTVNAESPSERSGGVFQRTVSQCGACRGAGETIKQHCGECKAQGWRAETSSVDVVVEPGMAGGQQIRVRGASDFGGDLVFVLAQRPHSVYTREGNDLNVRRRIALHEVSLCPPQAAAKECQYLSFVLVTPFFCAVPPC